MPSTLAPAEAAARRLAEEPTLEGARAALLELGVRFPVSVDVPVASLTEHLPPVLCGPVMLKVADPALPHKTEVGAVRPHDCPDGAALLEFVRDVEQRTGLAVRTVRVEERLALPEGGEAILALIHDPAFGPVACFGVGGRMTELRQEVVRWLPGLPVDLERLLETLPTARPWLHGFRGAPPLADESALARLLREFGEMALHLGPRALDLEINPLALTGKGFVALDLLLDVSPGRVPESPRPDLERLRKAMTGARSVAVAGPSTSDPGSLGRVLYDRLREDFAGEAWAVNPKGGEIDGRPVYPALKDLPGRPDLLVLAVPAARTAALLREAREADPGAVLVLASGFDEVRQGAVGAREEALGLGRIPVLGPNTMGLYANTGSPGDVRVDFLPPGRLEVPSFPDPRANNLALVVQSGARFASFADRQPGVGLRWGLMVGNAWQTDAADGVALAAADPAVDALAVYLEGLPPDGGRRLAEALHACRRNGQTVVLQKGGRTAAGAATARSHTASMSGSHVVFRAAVEQAGALLADTEADFLDLSRLASLLGRRRPRGKRLFLINGAGYEGVLAADEAARHGLELPPPPREAQEVLARYLRGTLDPDRNPADVGPATPDEAYVETLRAALPHYDMALVAVMPHGNGMRGDLGSLLRALPGDRPVVVSVNGGARWEPMRRELEAARIPVFPDAERAVRALGLWRER